MAGDGAVAYSHRFYALPARHLRARDTEAGDRRALVLHRLVQGPVRYGALAGARVRVPAYEPAVVHRGAAVVRRRVDALANRRARARPDDRRVARGRPAEKEGLTTTA